MLTIQDMWQSMKAVLRSARQHVNARLEPLGLTSAEGDVLFQLLAGPGGLPQEKLAERLDIGKAAVSRTVDSLAAKGYVRRGSRQGDARVHLVQLTPKAAATAAKIEDAYTRVYDIAKQGVPQAELQRVMVLLARVADNLRAEESGPDARRQAGMRETAGGGE